mgnify:CR=1 FL=1|jgi:hypothetical protein
MENHGGIRDELSVLVHTNLNFYHTFYNSVG